MTGFTQHTSSHFPHSRLVHYFPNFKDFNTLTRD
jgi:hypothetical protein